MKKPSVFVLKDFLLPGSLSGASLMIGIVLGILSSLQGAAIMTCIALLFAGIYIRSLIERVLELRKYEYIPSEYYALMVNYGGYTGSSDEEMILYTNKTLKSWGDVFLPGDVQNAIKNIGIIWVEFKEMPIPHPSEKGSLVAGYATTKKDKMIVVVGFKFKNQELVRTAFEHEVGHIIQAKVTGSWDSHHERSRFYGVK